MGVCQISCNGSIGIVVYSRLLLRAAIFGEFFGFCSKTCKLSMREAELLSGSVPW